MIHFSISRSSSHIKVIGSRSRSQTRIYERNYTKFTHLPVVRLRLKGNIVIILIITITALRAPFLKELRSRIADRSADARELQFLSQRIRVLIQRISTVLFSVRLLGCRRPRPLATSPFFYSTLLLTTGINVL